MGQIELRIAVMAGIVLSLFLIVGEIVALRKQAARLRGRWRQYYREARFARLFAELCGVAAFFLVQPVLVALVVIQAIDNFNPNFSAHAVQQLKQGLPGEK
jgi:uncharacterized membrane protein